MHGPRRQRPPLLTPTQTAPLESLAAELPADALGLILRCLDEDVNTDEVAVHGDVRVTHPHGNVRHWSLLHPAGALAATCCSWRDGLRHTKATTTLRVPSFFFSREHSLLAVPRHVRKAGPRLGSLRVLLFNATNLQSEHGTFFLNLANACPHLVAIALPKFDDTPKAIVQLAKWLGRALQALCAMSVTLLRMLGGQAAFPALRSVSTCSMGHLARVHKRPYELFDAEGLTSLRLRSDCVAFIKRFPMLERLVIEDWPRPVKPGRAISVDLDNIRTALAQTPSLVSMLVQHEETPVHHSANLTMVDEHAAQQAAAATLSRLPCLAYPGTHPTSCTSEWLAGVRASHY